MKTSSAKAKGRRAAQEVRQLILEIHPELKADDVQVTPSGVTGEDLKLSPAARDLLPIAIECKNVEKLNIWKALEQAESHSAEFEPVLFFKRNRGKLYAAVDATVLLVLIKNTMTVVASGLADVDFETPKGGTKH